MSIRVREAEHRSFTSPLQWLKFEEVELPIHINMSFRLHYTAPEGMWKSAYLLGSTCRKAGMEWKQVEECIGQVQSAVQSTGYFDQISEMDTGGGESDDSEYERLYSRYY